jgi:hypothetical protein
MKLTGRVRCIKPKWWKKAVFWWKNYPEITEVEYLQVVQCPRINKDTTVYFGSWKTATDEDLVNLKKQGAQHNG